VEGRGHQGAAVVLRAIIGTLLAANLVAAVMAFKPFGGRPPICGGSSRRCASS